MNAKLLAFASAIESAERVTPTLVVEAFLGERQTIFGRKLVPLTLGGWLALEKEAPAFIAPGAEIDRRQLAAAFFIFTMPSREVFSAVNSWSFRELSGRTLEGITGIKAHSLAKLFAAEVERVFSTSIAMRNPHSKGKGLNPGFGWWLSMLTAACSNFGWSADHALHDVPMVEIFALNGCHAWTSGLEPSGKTYLDDEIDRQLAAEP